MAAWDFQTKSVVRGQDIHELGAPFNMYGGLLEQKTAAGPSSL